MTHFSFTNLYAIDEKWEQRYVDCFYFRLYQENNENEDCEHY